MLSRKQAEINLRFFGYRYKGKKYGNDKEYEKALLRFQKTYKLPQTGKLDKKTDSLLVKKIKDLENMLYFLGHDVVVNGKFDKKDRAGVMAIQKKHKPKSYRKYKGIIDGPTWDTIKYYYKKKKNKKRYFFQNMNGNINWTVVERYGFKKSEFKCGCGGKYCDGYNRRGDKANPHLINFLIKLRAKAKKLNSKNYVQITCGVRCQRHNDELRGSVKNSQHIPFNAVDIYVKGMSRADVQKFAKKCSHYHYSYYGTPNMGEAIHVDFTK